MNRIYDVFVDNGLFVLAYYLDKEIENITEQDIFDSIDMMCEKINEFTRCEKYSNLKSMMFANSALTQPNSSKKVNDFLNDFYNSKGEETCCTCGNKTANIINGDLNRSYLPNKVAHTFYNFSNNLQGVNVCGICSILTMFSILNARVYGLAYLYNSDNDDFMYDYTYERQEENERDILSEAKKSKEKINSLNTVEQLMNNTKLYDGYIQIYKFNNSGQNQDIEIQDINSESVKLLSNIVKSGMLNEFKQFGLMYNLIIGNLRNVYLSKITKDDEMICSKELFEMLNREVNILSSELKEVIIKIADRLKNEDIVKIRKTLKLIKTFKDFEGFIVNLAEDYKDKYDDNLYTVDEYMLLDNKLKYNQIKNLMIVSLMQ